MPKQDTWVACGIRLAMSRSRSGTPTAITIRTLDRSRSGKSGRLTTGSQIVSNAARTIVQHVDSICSSATWGWKNPVWHSVAPA